jgi:hypothetical protein
MSKHNIYYDDNYYDNNYYDINFKPVDVYYYQKLLEMKKDKDVFITVNKLFFRQYQVTKNSLLKKGLVNESKKLEEDFYNYINTVVNKVNYN